MGDEKRLDVSPTHIDKYYDSPPDSAPERPERRSIPNKRSSKIVNLDNIEERPSNTEQRPAATEYRPTATQQPTSQIHYSPQQLKDLAYNANVDEEDKIRYNSQDKVNFTNVNPDELKNINDKLTSYMTEPSQRYHNNGHLDEKSIGDQSESSLILKYDGSNIDTTGEKARLVSVRKLGDSEGPNLHPLEGNSESSSTLPDSVGEDDIFLPKRYILAIMMFMGFVNMYAIRVNLNVAIGAMVNNHTVVQDGVAILVPPEFDWSSKLQGIVLGSFYYGYMVLQIPGGYFAMRFGGTRIFGTAVMIASVLTLFTPIVTRRSVWALVVLRILEGLVLGVMLPCNHQIWSSWAPLPERTTLITIALAGMNVGTVVTMPLTGLLTKYGFDGGWASVFYCFGLFGIIWYILWMLMIHPHPGTHPAISDRERKYIEKNTEVRKSMDIPWKAIFSSAPVYAVIVGNVANDWGLYMILICLPLFLMDIMHFNVQTMGFIASLPFLLKAIVGPLGGVVADVMRHKYMSTANVRRVFYIVGAMSAAVMIVIAGYSHTPFVAVFSMCVGVALSGLLHSAYEVNVLDIAPGLAGIVMGISNTAGTTTGFLSPLMVGYMTENKLRSEWNTVFWITFLVYAVGTLFYCLLCSGEAQHWAVDEDVTDAEIEQARSR